jgi:PKD repeat protein
MNRRIIGQLYGGGAACSGTNDNGQPDWYGRFDVSWDNGGSASSRLRDWLDPSNISTGVLDGFDPNSPSLALDAGIESIEEPSGNYCGTGSFTPVVELRNYGSDELTNVTINYNIDGGTNMTFNWTGNLAANTSVSVTLPTQNAGSGAHTFTAFTSNPNGGTDEDASNNESSSSFNVNLTGNTVDLQLILDCYGEETTWIIEDESNTTLYSGGPYTRLTPTGAGTINESFCLNTGCYSFTIFDSESDGIEGSIWGNCDVDGDYTITSSSDILAQMQNVNFGAQETVEFCVGSSITPNFEANSTSICAGESVNFTDLSDGTVTSWSWNFEGGNPQTIGDQNPTITYNTPGTYDVTLTIGDGTNTETLTLTDYIVVNALPTPTISANGPTTFCAGESVQLTSSSTSGNVWSTGVTTQSITVSTSGSYTVTVTVLSLSL